MAWLEDKEKPVLFSPHSPPTILPLLPSLLQVDRLVYGGELQGGFFLEAGAGPDAVTISNTLHFELEHGWTGAKTTTIGSGHYLADPGKARGCSTNTSVTD